MVWGRMLCVCLLQVCPLHHSWRQRDASVPPRQAFAPEEATRDARTRILLFDAPHVPRKFQQGHEQRETGDQQTDLRKARCGAVVQWSQLTVGARHVVGARLVAARGVAVRPCRAVAWKARVGARGGRRRGGHEEASLARLALQLECSAVACSGHDTLVAAHRARAAASGAVAARRIRAHARMLAVRAPSPGCTLRSVRNCSRCDPECRARGCM